MSDFKFKSSEELVKEARAAGRGDHGAFGELVVRNEGRVLANCRFLTRSDDAEDLAQEVFVKAFFGLKNLKEESKFGSWIQRIKVNHCLNYIKRKKDKDFVDVDSPTIQAAEELSVDSRAQGDIDRNVQQRMIHSILEGMTDSLRVPLILCDMDGLSYQEAADRLGIGLSALKMRLKRGREHFRERYTKRTGNKPSDGEEEAS